MESGGTAGKETGMEKRESRARGATLNLLKEQLYSLNRRMLLALQNRDEEEQRAIRREIEEVQEQIDGLGSGPPVRRAAK